MVGRLERTRNGVAHALWRELALEMLQQGGTGRYEKRELPPEAMVTSRPGCCLGLPVSVALLQLGSVLMSEALVITKGPSDVHSLGCQLKPC